MGHTDTATQLDPSGARPRMPLQKGLMRTDGETALN